MYLIFSLFLIFLSAHYFAFCSYLSSPIAYFLGLYVYVSANVVLSGLILGSLGLLDNQTAYILFESIVLVVAYFSFRLCREKMKVENQPKLNLGLKKLLPDLLTQTPDIGIFLICIAISLSFSLYLIQLLPPNSHDVLTTHLSRVGYWLQNGTYLPFSTHNLFDVVYPYNPALQAVWVVVMMGSDSMVEVFQWVAAIACFMATIGISRELGADKKSSLLKGLLFLTFPVVAMQSSTAQTDLVAAAFFCTSIYFLISGFQKNNGGRLIPSAISLGLALGSKQLIILIFPTIGFILFALYKSGTIPNYHKFVRWIGLAAAAIVAFGLPAYIINQAYYQNPFGPREIVSSEVVIDKTARPAHLVLINSLRLLYGAADPTGLPFPADLYLMHGKEKIAKPVLESIGIDLETTQYTAEGHAFSFLALPTVSEDESWFGIHGFILLAGTAFTGIMHMWKKDDGLAAAITGGALLYFLLIIISRPGWDLYQGRYFIVTAAMLMPLIPIQVNNTIINHLGRTFLIGVSLIILFNSHLKNSAKPLIGKEVIWDLDWAHRITMQNRSYRPLINDVRIHIPPNTNLGIIFTKGTWDYPLFGSNFERTVKPIAPPEKILDEAWLRESGIQYILVNTPDDPWEELPEYLNYFFQVDNFRFLWVRPAK